MKTSVCKANKSDRNETKDKTLPSPSPWRGRVSISILSKIKKIVYRYNNIEFKCLKFTQILCGIYILTVTFTFSGRLGIFGGARLDQKTNFIVDPNNDVNTRNGIIEYHVNPLFDSNRDGATISRAIVASTTIQMLLLGLSRFSGYFMYPAIVCVFWAKFRATQAFIDKTPLRVFCI